MNYPLISFLGTAIVISLSGVMAPGPMTAATLASGARWRHAGVWMAVGHGLVEFPLMLLIMAGAGVILQQPGFKVGVGMAGGVVLVLLGLLTIRGMLSKVQAAKVAAMPSESRGGRRNPIWTGVMLTGGNPYFLLWWATVGLTLITQAKQFGMLAFGVFAVVHWSCDLAWLEILSYASHRGSTVLGPRSQRVIMLGCGLAMAGFGVWFVVDAGSGAVRL